MLCDFAQPDNCHGQVLIETFMHVLDQADEDGAPSKYDVLSAACVLQGFDDDDESTDSSKRW